MFKGADCSNNRLQIEYSQMDKKNTGKNEANVGKIQPIGDQGRVLLVRPDGSGTYTALANNGDCYWRVAIDVLKSRSGRTPTDNQVANFVNELAAYNKKTDANILAVGEDIEIPPPGSHLGQLGATTPSTEPPIAPIAPRGIDQAVECPDSSEYTRYFGL